MMQSCLGENGLLYTSYVPFYLHGLISIPDWISKHMFDKVRVEIIYPFPNFNGCTVEVWEWISNFIPKVIMGLITYPCWYYNSIQVSKRGLWSIYKSTDIMLAGTKPVYHIKIPVTFLLPITNSKYHYHRKCWERRIVWTHPVFKDSFMMINPQCFSCIITDN